MDKIDLKDGILPVDPSFVLNCSKREELFQGEIFYLERAFNLTQLNFFKQSIGLGSGMSWDELRQIHLHLGPHQIWKILQKVRHHVQQQEFFKEVQGWVECLSPGEPFFLNPPSVRFCLPNGHQNPKAAPAYSLHRDTWYGYPGCVLNFWIPLTDTEGLDSFEIYPDFFNQVISNSSAKFNLNLWENDPQKAHYPTITHPLELGTPLQIKGQSGDAFIFSGQHLHQTCKHQEKLTRISLDFRVIYKHDLQHQTGAVCQDNQSTLLSWADPD